jgi:hypothetical protein
MAMATAVAEPTIIDGRHTRRVTTVGRVFGWFFLATFLTSIPAYSSATPASWTTPA